MKAVLNNWKAFSKMKEQKPGKEIYPVLGPKWMSRLGLPIKMLKMKGYEDNPGISRKATCNANQIKGLLLIPVRLN